MPRGLHLVARVLTASALLLAAGCSATHTVVLRADGSGTLTMHMEVSRLLHDYIAGLAEVSGDTPALPSGQIFDLAAIRKGFEAQSGIIVQKVASSDPRSLDIQVAFDSLQRVFAGRPGLQNANVVVLTQADGLETLKIHLDRSNYRQIAGFFPMLDNPVLQSLGPQAGQTTTENDYLEEVRFSLGDEGPSEVRKSSIVISIQPEGEIVSQTGGTVSGGSVVFRIPLLRLLVLATPLDFSMSFKPQENQQ
jgi:hypothetical protein